MSPDILDRLTAYAPTAASVADEWGHAERAQRLTGVLDDPGDTERRLRFRPRAGVLTSRAVAPIAASVTVLAVAGTLAVVLGHGSDRTPPTSVPGGGTTASAPAAQVFRATVATPRLRAHQWAYRALSSYNVSPNSDSTAQKSVVWVASTGRDRASRTTAYCVAEFSTGRAEQASRR